MSHAEARIIELENRVSELQQERTQLLETIHQLRTLMHDQLNQPPEKLALGFERAIYDSAIQILSEGRFEGMSEELFHFVHQNSPTAEDVLRRFGRKAS
jgi:hypothetical protein